MPVLPDWAEGKILMVGEAERHLLNPNQPRRLWTVVWTNGCFDILHPAHVQLFRSAKRLGDILVVGVNSDESVRRIKGPGRPVNGEWDRALVVLGVKGVDLVVIFDGSEPSVAIERLRPDIVVKGSGGCYDLPSTPEWPVIQAYGGRMVEVETDGSYSSSHIIDQARFSP